MCQEQDRERVWPDRLYKYMPLGNDREPEETKARKREYARRIIVDEVIHFSPPSAFNDPFDCQFIREFDATPEEEERTFLECLEWQRGSREAAERELADMLGPDGAERRQGLREFIRLNGETARDRTRVFCLTEVRDDILMWSHYADCHKGICLEFGFWDQFLGICLGSGFWDQSTGHADFLSRAWAVQYQTNFPVVNPHKTREGERIRPEVCTKSDHWRYEKEHRLVHAFPSPQGGDHEERLPPALLEGVILGARISDDSRRLVMEWATKRPRPLKVYEAKLKQREYGLDIVRLVDSPGT